MKLVPGKSYEIVFNDLKALFKVEKIVKEQAHLIDSFGKKAALPVKFLEDGVKSGKIVEHKRLTKV